MASSFLPSLAYQSRPSTCLVYAASLSGGQVGKGEELTQRRESWVSIRDKLKFEVDLLESCKKSMSVSASL